MIKNIKKDNKVIKTQKGFALVEVIAALGISALVITALISLSISTLRTSLDSELLLEGTKVANREIELVRAYRDGVDAATGEARSWEDFISDIGGCYQPTPCSIDVDNGVIVGSSSDQGSGAKKVTRSFVASTTSGDSLLGITPIPSVVRISVSVTWKVGDKDKGSYIYTDLSNWRGR
jgi:prepilin-type N-terminal cleavage/methylation domain-containing protein